jgi:hypothetical protein
MQIIHKYQIIDTRTSKDFKTDTYNKFKKKDVLKLLYSQIKNHNIDNSNHWAAELIISGNIVELFEKIIEFYITEISFKNPKYIIYLWKQYEQFTEIVNSLDDILEARNVLEIRNMFIDIITTITLCEQYTLPKIEKINALEISQFSNIRILFTNKDFLVTFIKSNDTPEIFTPINEIINHIKAPRNSSSDMIMYWLSWLVNWETEYIKKNKIGALAERSNDKVEKIYWRDFVWLLWEIVIHEAKLRNNETINEIVNKNYRFYVYYHNKKNKFKKLYFLIYSIMIFIKPLDTSTNIYGNFENYSKIILATANVNSLYNYIQLTNSNSIIKTN